MITVSRELFQWGRRNGYEDRGGVLTKTVNGYPVALYEAYGRRVCAVSYVGDEIVAERITLEAQRGGLPGGIQARRDGAMLYCALQSEKLNRRVEDFFKNITEYLTEHKVPAPGEICWHCGKSLEPGNKTEEKTEVLVHGRIQCVHSGCMEEYNGGLDAKREEAEAKAKMRSAIKIPGAVLGMLVGIALWLTLFLLTKGYVTTTAEDSSGALRILYQFVGIIMPALVWIGWRLGGGARRVKAMGLVIGLSVFGLIAATFGQQFVFLLKDTYLTPETMAYHFTSPGILAEQVLLPLLMGVVFAGLGFWPVYMNAREPQTVETDEMELLA